MNCRKLLKRNNLTPFGIRSHRPAPVGRVGIEPTSKGLWDPCSAIELPSRRAHDTTTTRPRLRGPPSLPRPADAATGRRETRAALTLFVGQGKIPLTSMIRHPGQPGPAGPAWPSKKD